MRNFIVVVILSFFCLNLKAQTIVSTQPSNKNVILEEFTGIHCPYCPDGHKIANQLMANNPGRVFAINIHQGTYAAPSSGEPDYRTPFGDALANQSGLTGYPAGTINRHVFTSPTPMTPGKTAQSRGNWTNCTNQILAMPSPVNIAIDVSLNYQTRELTLLVEVYYTGNADSSTNKLNIAILQDYVKGPQAGSSLNPSYVTPDGQYYHMHMLRTFLTGQWGWTIPQTTAGTFWDTTITYIVPTAYHSIPVDLGNLKVVAFVSEGKQEILTGTGKKVPSPPLDASIIGITNVSSLACESTLNPKFRIKNEGTDTIYFYEIEYGIRNFSQNTILYNDTIPPNQTHILDLPGFQAANGYNPIYVKVNNPNGGIDGRTFNNEYEIKVTRFFQQLTPPYTQNFSSTTFPPVNMSIEDVNQCGRPWKRSSAGGGSALVEFYYIEEGKENNLYLPSFNFSNLQQVGLAFKLAHRMYSSEYIDKLYVEVSTDCGNSWTTVWFKQDPNLATNSSPYTNAYTSPATSDWRDEFINLSNYAGQSNVLIRFRAVSGYGNNLFVDNINVSENVSIFELGNIQVALYPNPTSDNLSIQFDNITNENIRIQIYSVTGNVIFDNTYFISASTISIPVKELPEGVYFINLISSQNFTTKTFVIQR
ncbi:MAG: Omp28-related outer membrane protein [Bacteroidales bacterium]|nr:Omp28-related outer membrane protein [Bacteroidales bacterium]